MTRKVFLKEIATITTGSTAPKDKFFSNKGLPFIRAGHLETLIDTNNINDLPKIDNETAKQLNLKKVGKGTILFAKSGMSSTKNRVYLCTEEVYIVSHLAAIIPNSEVINNYYLKYYLEWYKPSRLIIDESYPSIRVSDIENIEIVLPTLEVQTKIVNILEQVVEIIKMRNAQITALDELTQSVFLEMFGDPVLNKKNFPKEKLGETGKLNRGISKHRPRNAPELLGGPYPLIQTGDVARSGLFIENFNTTYSELGLKQSKMWEAGTLCITIAANIAKTSILKFDACFPDSVVGYKPFQNMNSIFVHYWFTFFQKILENSAPESAQKNINLKILNDLEIITPPIEQQNEFATKILEIYDKKKKLEGSKELMQELFNSLLQKSFNGELFQDQA